MSEPDTSRPDTSRPDTSRPDTSRPDTGPPDRTAAAAEAVDVDAAPLTLRDIRKSYGGVRAIRHADFSLEPGTVHALIGENGAGKSTLIKILAGAEQADAGTITINDEPVTITNTGDAIGLGIQTVYQEPQLFASLSVAENVFVGREVKKGIRIDWAAQAAQMRALLETVGLDERISTQNVGDLSIAQQQQVSIAKALAGEARILILDEPSAILTDAEIDVLFAVIRRLTARGVGVIYISHRLDELHRIAQHVTVMRDGRTIATRPMSEITVREMAEMMVGGEIVEQRDEDASVTDKPVLELVNLAAEGHFHDISLTVHAGEIVGMYGLVGSGAEEVGSCVYGMTRRTGGEIRLHGQPVTITRPSSAKKRGIWLLPANRASQGSFSFQSIAFNITIGAPSLLSKLPGWVERRVEKTLAGDMIKRLAIKTPSEKQPISAMSGGNAQKVVLARQIIEQPELLILAEPTQGVDVGAKEEIHRIVSGLAGRGTAVLIVTSDLGEVLRTSHRILVVRRGEIVAEFGPDATQVQILAAAAGEAGEEALAQIHEGEEEPA